MQKKNTSSSTGIIVNSRINSKFYIHNFFFFLLLFYPLVRR